MSHKSHGNPVATYIITALILGVITYIEYAIVEYEIAWLSSGMILFWLFALSILKFIMVVAIFMHLKDDEKTYTGFFSSGMLIALATFLILPLLFTVRENTAASAVAAPIEIHGEEGEGEASQPSPPVEESRSRAEVLDNPPPMDRSLQVDPPTAAEPQATLRSEAAAGEAAQQQAAQEAAQEETQDAAAPEGQAPGEEPAAAAEFDRELGEGVYSANCQGCHQGNGQGMPGVFPPLADNMPQLYNADGGREYLIHVVLHGLSGQIEVNGQAYNGVMPPWAGSLSDEQIAAVLNHELTAWGNEEQLEEFTPIAADEVAALRGSEPGDLNAQRSQLLGE